MIIGVMEQCSSWSGQQPNNLAAMLMIDQTLKPFGINLRHTRMPESSSSTQRA